MKLNPITKMLQQHFRQPEKTPFAAIFPKTKITRKIYAGEQWQAMKAAKAARLAITSGSLKPYSEQERQEAHANNSATLANLYHCENLSVALSYAEMRVHLLKIVLALHRDDPESDFPAANAIYSDMVAALSDFSAAKKHGTPQENQKKLQSLADWFDLLYLYSEFVPAAAFDAAAIYNTGIQVINYFNRIMVEKPEYVAATFRIIRSESVESVATKYKLTQNAVRQNALLIGQAMYRMGFVCESYAQIQPADKIPQLRASEYVELADLSRLVELANKARQEFCLPFEYKFGISQVNWRAFDRETAHGLMQIKKLL